MIILAGAAQTCKILSWAMTGTRLRDRIDRLLLSVNLKSLSAVNKLDLQFMLLSWLLLVNVSFFAEQPCDCLIIHVTCRSSDTPWLWGSRASQLRVTISCGPARPSVHAAPRWLVQWCRGCPQACDGNHWSGTLYMSKVFHHYVLEVKIRT